MQMTAMDRLIGADKGSEAAFGSLWDLASIARSVRVNGSVMDGLWFSIGVVRVSSGCHWSLIMLSCTGWWDPDQRLAGKQFWQWYNFQR
jgi:hypothetical protein